MNFLDIRAYPERMFKKYWRQINSDPSFTTIVGKLSEKYSWVSGRFSQLTSWEQYRKVLYQLVSHLVNKTTGGLSWSGTENLPIQAGHSKGAIFISTHRSISLDPIFFNYMFFEEKNMTVYNAVGDNLLQTPWLGHLIRLNGGFIVKRKIEDFDKKLQEAHKLSLYIRKLVDRGKHVWIAQRNGRAKDGNDRTDSAVLAMLKLAHDEKSWGEFSEQIPIIPVSMSYEEVPLDTVIVQDYLGELGESDFAMDSTQIMKEIVQKKRQIHIHVSERVKAEKRNELVRLLDESIIRGVKIWDSNTRAYEIITKNTSGSSMSSVQWLKEKLSTQSPKIREALLRFYAAPLINLTRLLKR